MIWWFIGAAKEAVGIHEINTTIERAEAGDVNEQTRLAMFYQQNTFNIGRNDNEAIRWYSIASSNGSKSAKEILCNDYNICERN